MATRICRIKRWTMISGNWEVFSVSTMYTGNVRHCGDANLLGEQYPGIQKYIGYEQKQLRQGLSNSVLNDWLPPSHGHYEPNAPEGGTLTAAAYTYRAVQ